MKNTNSSICGYCNPTKVLPSSYPNQISIIEGIIRVSSFCDDFSDCFSKENLANFIIGYLDPIIECNILRDENGEEKHTVFNAFHTEMIKKYGPCPIHRKSFLRKRPVMKLKIPSPQIPIVFLLE